MDFSGSRPALAANDSGDTCSGPPLPPPTKAAMFSAYEANTSLLALSLKPTPSCGSTDSFAVSVPEAMLVSTPGWALAVMRVLGLLMPTSTVRRWSRKRIRSCT
ncbi:hypothetical protein D3C71_1144850 [compost metagenome]